MHVMLRRAIGPAAVWLAAVGAAHAQQQLPPPPAQQQAAPPQVSQGGMSQGGMSQGNPVCARLETQLQTFDRGSADQGRAEQLGKFEAAAASQQAEIDRQEDAARRMGCNESNFFALFSGGRSQQCGPLNSKISQMRANLDRINADLERLREDPAPERDAQRRAILVALSQNNCGAQYRAAVAANPPARSGGFFDTLFGPGPGTAIAPPGADAGFAAPGGTYRTVCVRTCDGFFYPISFATNPSRFPEDEKICQNSCPATEVQLFTHKNPGEDINQAVSVNGNQPYTSLPNAFKYRQAWDNNCSCRKTGESWAQTMKGVDDPTVEQGDIVVNEQRAKQLSQPPRGSVPGKPVAAPATRTAPPRSAQPAAPAAAQAAPANPLTPAAIAAQAAPADGSQPVKPDPNRQIREVGPTFIPAR
ncbi:DUF2865 domain-containing protein [Rhodoplanes sp. Z2-YC6860]|uniref:DUF2865 domain-containing protein n=1 Tax=Rhodoplanes sp. Z2-YC6860 TaxID=674703 RepID=UPI00078E97F5|nr:DUF2865 domain-containing protein [Rhodoplanes sp. Z2-YC6860]AMN41609.1 hypothetical protein RHPLAN_31740 [Rhodoplanes sp. Z2-YC6860]